MDYKSSAAAVNKQHPFKHDKVAHRSLTLRVRSLSFTNFFFYKFKLKHSVKLLIFNVSVKLV